jgi:P2 family phage contractile tail tube protein
MAAAAQIRKNFNLFLDGFGYAGNCEEYQAPTLGVQVEDFRAGGMDASVALDMGQEKMEATFKLSQIAANALRLWGVGQGQTFSLIVRGALEDLDSSVKAEVFTQRGTIRTIEWDAVTPGAKAGVSLTMDIREFSYDIDGVRLHDIDVLNMKRIVNGVDRLAAQRAAIGL